MTCKELGVNGVVTFPPGVAPAGVVPAGVVPAGDVPAGVVPIGVVPVVDVPVVDVPVVDVPVVDVPVGSVAVGDGAGLFEVLGVGVGVDVVAAQAGVVMVSWIRVTAPLPDACSPASSRPSTVTLSATEMSSKARIVPRKIEPDPRVAELPTARTRCRTARR
jgi:hypothetical protein